MTGDDILILQFVCLYTCVCVVCYGSLWSEIDNENEKEISGSEPGLSVADLDVSVMLRFLVAVL